MSVPAGFRRTNLHQKVRKFGQNLNGDTITYLIKYTLPVEFSIKDYTIILFTELQQKIREI